MGGDGGRRWQGKAGGTRDVPVPVAAPVVSEIQVEYSNGGNTLRVFWQYELDYINMPSGFERKGKVLKLKKTLYGLCQSPRAFWKFMVEKMELCGMPQFFGTIPAAFKQSMSVR